MTHPERLGKYPITGVIGEGAMGVVYKAVDPVIQRAVAIKTIHRQLVRHDDDPASSFAARFRNEAQAVGRLSHPSIVAIYEYGEDEDTAFIAMEYVEGHNLSQLLATTPLPSDAVIVRVMDQLLSALACAHDAGVWHRDIKPANLIVTAGGQVKVTDFGIARIENQQLTQVTSVVGTPGYIAPEQYTGAPLDHRVDLFAAGVLMYRMLTGNSPFAGSPEVVMYKTVNETPLPPSEASGGRRPVAFDAVVAKAIAKNPEDRHATATAFRQALLVAAGTPGAVVHAPLPSMPSGAAPAPFEPTQPATHPSAGSVLSASSVGGWDVADLAPIELALATVLGPMAKLLVRQAARSCADMATLIERVAGHITDAKARDGFVKRLAAVPNRTRSTATAAPAMATSPPLTDPGGILPSTVISHALRVMTVHMGPIARIVVKKAAAMAQTTDAFYALLAEQAGESGDRKRVLKLLRSRMD
ncbi:serine/threonine-protein kinase [Piscinibacter sp.]|uniref:serine/threonine-protein kinase n=1 Tax=Piscinibacter sp. TaxID=1903157 RepID=UPI002BFA19ED|nr:serine/threonine-protein kinase [Albitalea sp.]HUG23338.1 serine/threonine-protein kinase [Albitalea sp.]